MFPALERVFHSVGCRTQVELALFLGIRQSSVSDAKKRRVIPAEWLIKILRDTGVNPEWIMTGQGPRMLQPVDYAEIIAPPTVYIREVKPPEECSIEELVTEVVRRVFDKAAEEKNRFY